MYKAYITTIEARAAGIESAAARLDDEDKKAIMILVRELRKETQALREQVDL
jgi:hypothetical protein